MHTILKTQNTQKSGGEYLSPTRLKKSATHLSKSKLQHVQIIEEHHEEEQTPPLLSLMQADSKPQELEDSDISKIQKDVEVKANANEKRIMFLSK